MMSLKRKRDETINREPCARCRSMTGTLSGLKSLRTEDGFEHYDKVQLRKSAKLGCPVCNILSYKLQMPSGLLGPVRIAAIPTDERVNAAVDADLDHPFRSKKLIGLYITNSKYRENLSWAGIRAYTPTIDKAAAHLPVLPVVVSVHGPEILKKIKDRLKICQEQHHECAIQEKPILPRRIIDVDTGEISAPAKLCINDDRRRGEYTCLSYCWGGTQELATTTATLEQYSNCLPLDKLPQTIRDAISVTRSLAVRYLWVDAFCILQDSTDDKSVQIGEMGRIYKNAKITIAAASSQRVTEGFLIDRTIPNSHQLPFYLSASRCGSIWLRTSESFDSRTVDPLELRGWTFQESLLSRRLIYYGSRDLMWTCQREHFVPVNKTHSLYDTYGRTKLPASIFIHKGNLNNETARSRCKLWLNLLESYSNRQLTIFEDRLPALAGIASELHKIWKDDYLAGIWGGSLIHSIAWFSPASFRTDLPLEPYRSPSWSWASSRGQIWFWGIRREHAELVACTVIPVDEKSQFGHVRSGDLVLRAAIKPIPSFLNSTQFNMDLGPEGRRSTDQDSRLLLLGYGSGGAARCLVIAPVDDGKYLRIGSVKLRTQFTGFWQEPGLTREIITIV